MSTKHDKSVLDFLDVPKFCDSLYPIICKEIYEDRKVKKNKGRIRLDMNLSNERIVK
jgi:hypothetical protein